MVIAKRQHRTKALGYAMLWPAFIPILLLFGIYLFLQKKGDSSEIAGTYDLTFLTFFGVLLFSLFCSAVLCALIGLPVHILLNRFGRMSLVWYLGSASVICLMLSIPFLTGPLLIFPEMFIVASLLLGGPFAAFIFWHTLRPDLPDRDEPLSSGLNVK